MARSVRLSIGRRACWLDVNADRARLGSQSDNAIVIQHPSVLGQHAELLFRRAGTILRPLGQARVYLGETAVETPVVLSPERGTFRLGDVSVRLEATSVKSLLGTPTTDAGTVVRRIDCLEAGLQRYLTEDGSLVTQGRELRRLISADHPHLSSVGAHQGGLDFWWVVERAPPGIQLSALLSGGRLTLPPAAKLRVVAHVAEALAGLHRAGGVHGAFSNRFVHVTADGDAQLLRSWTPKPELLNTSAPERRWGVQASLKTDVYEWASWALGWLTPSPPLLQLLRPHRHMNPKEREGTLYATVSALRHLAWSDRADPAQGALARAAQLGIDELTAPPFATVP